MKRLRALYISFLWFLLFLGIRAGISLALAGDLSVGLNGILQTVSANAAEILLLSNIIIPFFIVIAIKLNNNRLTDMLGIHRTGLFDLLISAVFAAVSTPVVRFLVNKLPFPESAAELLGKLPHIGLFDNALPVLTVVVLMPIAEEFAFRGAIFNMLHSGCTKFTSVLLTGILFSLFYPDLRMLIFAFIMGTVINIIYIRFNSLWTAIIAHICCAAVYKYFDLSIYGMGLQYGVLLLCAAASVSVFIWITASSIRIRKASRAAADE